MAAGVSETKKSLMSHEITRAKLRLLTPISEEARSPRANIKTKNMVAITDRLVNRHGVKPTAAVGSSQSPSDASFFDEAHRPSTSAELPNSQYLETSSDPATPSIQPILIRESDSAAKVTKRKSTPDEPPCSASAYQSVMNMQQIEHELQVKRYKQQIFMQETEEERRIAEHEQRMKVWKLQETLLTDLIKRQRNSRDGDDSSTISISRVLAQLE
ncbi:uncharacterized protein LOC135486491 isoform X2 [Lineus longissimus]|uniref:uncharacterized protein LOC135486491 isoform X2 n=1 Tax=Lineus longissimus TaxID=88925 RepID=UPI00315D6C78